MPLITIDKNRVVFQCDSKQLCVFDDAFIRCSHDRGYMLVSFNYPYAEYYYYEPGYHGGIRKTLNVRYKGGKVVAREYSSLCASNAQSLSACLRKGRWSPCEFMTVYDGDGRGYACERNFVQSAIEQANLPYFLQKNDLGTWVPVKRHIQPLKAAQKAAEGEAP